MEKMKKKIQKIKQKGLTGFKNKQRKGEQSEWKEED